MQPDYGSLGVFPPMTALGLSPTDSLEKEGPKSKAVRTPTIWNRPTKRISSRCARPTAMSHAPALTAAYSAPDSEPKAFAQPLPSSSKEPSTAERTASLAALRSAITDTQDQVNAFLTDKMDEDNRKAGAPAVVDDTKAEELYGEETVDED
jgi:hypothetical protein